MTSAQYLMISFFLSFELLFQSSTNSAYCICPCDLIRSAGITASTLCTVPIRSLSWMFYLVCYLSIWLWSCNFSTKVLPWKDFWRGILIELAAGCSPETFIIVSNTTLCRLILFNDKIITLGIRIKNVASVLPYLYIGINNMAAVFVQHLENSSGIIQRQK